MELSIKLSIRPTFEQLYMNLAWGVSLRSTCRRLHVGCVITSADFRDVVTGYNGGAAGLVNDCDSDEPGKCGCVHAEANAVINCKLPRSVPKVAFVTDLPCVQCAKYLINLGGVERVVYHRDYRIRDSIKWFQRADIQIESMPDLWKDPMP